MGETEAKTGCKGTDMLDVSTKVQEPVDRQQDVPQVQGIEGTKTVFWDEQRIARLKELIAQQLSCTEIGAILGCSKNAVVGKVRRLRKEDSTTPKLKSQNAKPWGKEEDEILIRLWEAKIEPKVIARKLNRTANSVRNHAGKLGLPSRTSMMNLGTTLTRSNINKPIIRHFRHRPIKNVKPKATGITCQWIEDDPQIDNTKCGEPTVWHTPTSSYPYGKESVYCAHHHMRAYYRIVDGEKRKTQYMLGPTK